MKKLVITGLFIILSLPLVLTACGSGGVSAAMGEEITLPVGKTVTFTDVSLKITFEEVTSDSRCPEGAQCVQAGDVKCLMKIDYSDSEASLVFTQTGGGGLGTKDFNVYHIAYDVQPYPQTDQEIKASDYQMILTVTKFQQ